MPQERRMKKAAPHKARAMARLLGIGGALPFVAGGLGAWLFGDSELAHWLLRAVQLYGAVILSFLGGIVWGMALKNPGADRASFVISIIPALLAWIALLIPHLPLSLGLLILGLSAQLAVDLGRMRLAPWFRNLRMGLTAAAVSSLMLALFASIQ